MAIFDWLNMPGLIAVIALMVPNVIYARKHPEGFENLWHNKAVETLEQVGRFGCFGLMIVIIPSCGFGFASDAIFLAYLCVDVVLVVAYCVIWGVCFSESSLFRALALSVLPSAMFLFSGIISGYVPLVVAAILFAPCHVLISVKNALATAKEAE